MENYRKSERGISLVLVMVVLVLMVGLTYAYLVQTTARRLEVSEAATAERSIQLADSSISAAVAELNSGTDTAGDGLGAVSAVYGFGNYLTAATDIGDFAYRIVGVGDYNERKRAIEVIAQQDKVQLTGTIRAAITANGDVDTLGSIIVDGRDYDIDGINIVGPGGQGISSRGNVVVGGSSSAGGNGQAPITNAGDGDGVFEQNASWGDGIDNDGDGLVDEEDFDGVDNDGDGLIDEDIGDSYPINPDVSMHLPTGTLEAVARAMGTYFSDQAAFENYLSTQGGNIPGGVIVMLDFDYITPMNFGEDMNDDPSIIVMHNATGDAEMKNLHGQFKGLVMADVITHINGDIRIVGAVHSFSRETLGNAYGNGNAEVLFSSAALGKLPLVGVGSLAVKSWREIAVPAGM